MNLKVNDKIDFRDINGRFWNATIKGKNESNLKILYNGCYETCDYTYTENIHRFAPHGSRSMRPAHRFMTLKKGDDINIRTDGPPFEYEFGLLSFFFLPYFYCYIINIIRCQKSYCL